MKLSKATVGKTYQVIKIDGVAKSKRRLFDLGINRGCILKVLTKATFGGTMLLSLKSYRLSLRGEAASLVTVREVQQKNKDTISGFDKIALSQFWALPIFILISAIIFYLSFGAPTQFISSIIERAVDLCSSFVFDFMSFAKFPKWFVGLITDGIINGVGSIFAFLPQIVMLLFLLNMLDECGYSARVAFILDGLLEKVGLSGRTAFSLLSGLGCSVSAIMSTRGIGDDGMRKKTALIVPVVSCSARLPIYALIASAFFFKGKFIFIALTYLLSIITVLTLAFIYDKFLPQFKTKESTFIMELPSYRFPPVNSVIKKLFSTIKSFLFKIGTIILSMNVIVYALTTISFGNGKSLLQLICGFFAPLFYPLGFGSWQAVSALFSGFVAKETLVTTIESLGGVSVIFTNGYELASAVAFTVYTLLYVPCLATLSVQIKELGLASSLLSLAFQLVIAYMAALAIRLLLVSYQVNKIVFWSVIAFALLLFMVNKLILLRKKKKAKISLTKL